MPARRISPAPLFQYGIKGVAACVDAPQDFDLIVYVHTLYWSTFYIASTLDILETHL
jgi:hypothetical protein